MTTDKEKRRLAAIKIALEAFNTDAENRRRPIMAKLRHIQMQGDFVWPRIIEKIKNKQDRKRWKIEQEDYREVRMYRLALRIDSKLVNSETKITSQYPAKYKEIK